MGCVRRYIKRDLNSKMVLWCCWHGLWETLIRCTYRYRNRDNMHDVVVPSLRTILESVSLKHITQSTI